MFKQIKREIDLYLHSYQVIKSEKRQYEQKKEEKRWK